MSFSRRIAAFATGALALLASAAPAAAHVTVNPREVPKGGFTKLAFRVPNERPDSGTVSLEVSFPPEHPFRSLSVRPQPGWTFTVEKLKLDKPIEREGEDPVTEVVSKITWSGGLINPGEFNEFEVSGGPMPEKADQLVFKAVQTYASGEVVRWIEEPTAGAEEPEHPAPVLKLIASKGGHGSAGAAKDDPAGGSETKEFAGAQAASKDDVDGANQLAVAALILGGIGLLVGVASLFRNKPSSPTTPDAPSS